jgi:hypothetical protein
MLEPDRDQIEIFVNALFRHAAPQGFVSLRAFYEDGGAKPFRITPTALAGGLKFLVDVAEDDARRAANDPQRVVFCPPIATFTNKERAGEKDLAEGLALSVECDQAPTAARGELERLLCPATLVVRSGGTWIGQNGHSEDKLHLHWRLAKPASGTELAKLKRVRDQAARIVGADTSNVPVCHCIRWPGSWHKKSAPRLCEIIAVDPDRELKLEVAFQILSVLGARSGNGPSQQQPNGGSDWDELVANLQKGRELHRSLTAMAMKLLVAGMNDGAAVRHLRALMNASQAPRDQRWQDRFDYIPRAVRTAREKLNEPPQPATATAVFDPWERYIVPAFPFDILPAVVQDFVSTQSAVIGCCPSATAMAALGTFSGALHHGFALKMLRDASWYEHVRLWILLIAEASQRKTPLLRTASWPLVQYEKHLRENHERELYACEIAKTQADEASQIIEPEPPPRYLAWDTTTEKLGEILARNGEKGILVLTDEISGWLGSMERYNNSGSRADRAFWLSAYDGGPRTVDRIKRGEQYIPNLSASILGAIQPARLAEIQGLTSDGLLQRFIPVIMSSAKFRQDRASEDKAYSALVRELIFAKPARLIMTDDALAIMTKLHEHLFHLEQASEGLAAGFSSFVGKLHGLTGSLAVVLHLAHDPKCGATYPVDEQTIENVRRLTLDFILPHAFEFYRGAGPTEGDRLRRLASWILTSGKRRILASDLTTNVRDLRELTLIELNERVSPLVAGGWLEPSDKTPTCRVWTVAPQVHVQLAERAKSEAGRKTALAALLNPLQKAPKQ